MSRLFDICILAVMLQFFNVHVAIEAVEPDSTFLKEKAINTVEIIQQTLDKNKREDNSIFYFLSANESPSDSLMIDPKEITIVLENIIKNAPTILGPKDWRHGVEYLFFLNRLGWINSDILFYSMGQKNIEYKRSYFENACEWVKIHENLLTRSRIYEYLRLSKEINSYWNDDVNVYTEVVDSLITELFNLQIIQSSKNQ